MVKTAYYLCPHCGQMIEVKVEGEQVTKIVVTKDSTVGKCGGENGAIPIKD